ncbi:hypothetical protein E2C01_075306 [Portunus trituberculatus]|uniref:Uncharacterized protein n=1 Tax=Portunus trituberculatus TaxID=210409 RepID=A0A5B7IGR0_PORTR|nr:hypothetical protein [Portunus trituberculatus]
MRCWGRGWRQKTRREKELGGENELREARDGEGDQIKGIQNKSVVRNSVNTRDNVIAATTIKHHRRHCSRRLRWRWEHCLRLSTYPPERWFSEGSHA